MLSRCNLDNMQSQQQASHIVIPSVVPTSVALDAPNTLVKDISNKDDLDETGSIDSNGSGRKVIYN